ncbi:MAG TPA: glycosyltransferase [Mucilaginibacter sp.]|jgi:glycosyltransferase involved in cell wall biosynthesis|nr:glycosyltransferase [Mucilaginibacter sp.]
MELPTLSYIISTKNRLPFIKILLGALLPRINADEEIVVVDGDSTDGTKEYLQELYKTGKIHRFLSEPDNNQAEGWNKALLMATGTIIKKLIDDDVPDIDAIRKCRDFMLKNPAIDICISNTLDSNLANPEQISTASRLSYYEQWKSGKTKTFTFSDVSILQRRSSLSLLGLYDTQFRMIDWEYSLRATYLGAGIAYYTGYNALSVTTPGNVTSTATKKQLKYEEQLGRLKYEYPGDEHDISLYSKIKIWAGKRYYKNKLPIIPALPPEAELKEIYSSYYQKLEEQNKTGSWEFIC